jgi:hypothetical protein
MVLSEQQKADRVALSQEMLQAMNDLGRSSKKYRIRGDEMWICWDNKD